MSARISVLVVEDSEADYVLTAALLRECEHAEFDIEWASTHEQGLKRLLSNEHDVCLLDYQLDGYTGTQMLLSAERLGCRTPVLLLTGAACPSIDAETLACGAADYLLKGAVDSNLLHRAIRYAIERQRYVLTLRQKQEELARLNEAKDRLIENVNHELRTPLATIKSASRALDEEVCGELTTRQRRFINIIERQADRLAVLTDDLHDVSQLDMHGLRCSPTFGDLSHFVERVCDDLEQLCTHAGISLKVDAGDAVRAHFDADRISQVLCNLLSNSIKFTPPGGAIFVRVFESHGEARLELEDTGLGIAEDALSKIFERTFTMPTPDPADQAGKGLGLAICSTIIEQGHRGTIGAQSELGRGTTFRITLPGTPESRSQARTC